MSYSSFDQIVNGRICGDIAVSRAFGDIRFKTKKDELGSFSSYNCSSSFFLCCIIAHKSLYTQDVKERCR